MGLLDDIENAVEGALNDLESVVNAIEDAVKEGLQVAGDVVAPIGSAISYVVNGVVYVGDWTGKVYALTASTGSQWRSAPHWNSAAARVRRWLMPTTLP